MICVICNNKINTNIDRWVLLRDYNGNKIDGEVSYHLKCWKNKEEQFDKKCKQKVEQGIQQAMGMVRKLTGKEEEYVIQ